MQRRHEARNIPIEVLRSFVIIQESGSFTRAADMMRLTQPAISAQIKRLQQLVGGEVFVKSAFGIQLTEKGEIVNRHARRILAMNDQIISLAGSKFQAQYFRVGIPSVLAPSALPAIVNACRPILDGYQLQFSCDLSAEIVRSLTSGYLDIACHFTPAAPSGPAVDRWDETQCWVCAPDLIVAPGTPIPLASWRSGFAHHLAIQALETVGLQYSIAFSASDFASQITAVRLGMGYAVLPERLVPADLKIVRDKFLPPLPPFGVGIYLRDGIESGKATQIALKLGEVLRAPSHALLQQMLEPDRLIREAHVQAARRG